jgi:hypothetical protein
VNLYFRTFNRAARKTLAALPGFTPSLSLSGRAALWWLTIATGPVKRLGLVWHGRDGLGILPQEICDRLKAKGLDPGTIHGDLDDPRWLWLGVGDKRKSSCAVKLMTNPDAPLSPAKQFPLYDSFIYVESWRDIRRTALCSFCEEANPQDAADLYLLYRRRPFPRQALLDAQRRNPGFDPRQLLNIARIHSRDVDLPERYRADFLRFRSELVAWIMAYLEDQESGEA